MLQVLGLHRSPLQSLNPLLLPPYNVVPRLSQLPHLLQPTASALKPLKLQTSRLYHRLLQNLFSRQSLLPIILAWHERALGVRIVGHLLAKASLKRQHLTQPRHRHDRGSKPRLDRRVFHHHPPLLRKMTNLFSCRPQGHPHLWGVRRP